LRHVRGPWTPSAAADARRTRREFESPAGSKQTYRFSPALCATLLPSFNPEPAATAGGECELSFSTGTAGAGASPSPLAPG
jgi:hypothetical protein